MAKMIDLRSDTLTLPSKEMMAFAFSAPVGDAGRMNDAKRSCDPSVTRLEDYACHLTGKEAALFLPSGTMGNHVALLTHCVPGSKVLLDRAQHSYRIEKAAFTPFWGQLIPVFYELTESGLPQTGSVKEGLQAGVDLLCVENTHNGAGGVFLPKETLKTLRTLSKEAGVPIHMDGARLFNAAVASGMTAAEICSYADSVMFCVSKGLGAPMGSLLCGSNRFIEKAAEQRKLLGGNLRQAGFMAAAGEFALHNNIERLKEDHRRTGELCRAMQDLPKIEVPSSVQSNMIIFNVSKTGLTSGEFITRLKKHGLWLSTSGNSCVRMLLYDGISDEDIQNAIQILKEFLLSL